MARLNQSLSYSRESGSNTFSDFGRSPSSTVARSSSISNLVISSPAYKSAFELFSAEPNKIWLTRLEAIPYSVNDANNTFLDDLGLSKKYEDKQDANYQFCMEQINALVEQYQIWKNNLPVEQARQDSAAGINSAISGDLTGSQINPVSSPSSNPSNLPSEDVLSFLNNTANFLLSTTNGFADIALKFKDLRMRRDKQTFDIDLSKRTFADSVSRYMREHGIKPMYANEDFSYNDITFDNLRDLKFLDPEGKEIVLDKVLQFATSSSYMDPLIAKAFWDGHSFVENYGTLHDDSFSLDSGSYTKSIGLDATVSAQYELHKLRIARQLATEKYNSESAKHSADSAEYNKVRDSYTKEIEGYKKKEQKIRTDLIERLSKSKNQDDMLLLSKILTGYNYDDVDILSAEADIIETEKALGVAGQVVDMITD